MIVDGHAMAYRAHYALVNQNLTDASGMPTETIFGFFRMLGKLLEKFNPEYLLIVFDPPRPNFRHEMYSEYKANRKETPDSLRVQLDEVKELTEKLSLPVIIPENEEADDAIASIVEREKNTDLDIFIVSSDKDLFNILYSNVKMLRAKKGVSDFIEIDSEYVKTEFNLRIDQIPDFMALTGDTSDNVPGVKGIGDKTAKKLIQEFDSLDNLYENIEKINSESTRQKLLESKDNAYLSKKLVSLKKDLKNIPDIDNLLWRDKIKPDEHLLLFKTKGYVSVYNEWTRLFLEENEIKNLPVDDIAKDLLIIKTEKEYKDLEKRIPKAAEISIDTETTSISPTEAKLVGVSLSFKENEQYITAYIPVVFDEAGERHFDYQDVVDGVDALNWIKPVLENENIKKIGQNIKYDWIVLENHGINLKNVYYDTMAASYLINPAVRKHNLDDLALTYLGHETIKYKDLAGVGQKQKALVSLPLFDLAKYAGEDAEVTLRLKEKLEALLKKENLTGLYEKIDMPLISVLKTMEQNGILLDLKYLKTLHDEYSVRCKELEKNIHKEADEEFNIQSTKELQRILFEKLKIESAKKTQKGQLSTSADTLEAIRDKHPIINYLLEYRGYTKLLSTYIDALPEYVNSKTKRVHTSFSQTITATGRLASSAPNLQNIPIKEKEGRVIRKAFIAEKNHELLSLDYSQIELRVLAHYCKDENLTKAYKNDEDIHDQAAYLLFRNKFDEKNNCWIENGDESEKIHYGEIDAGILEKMKQTSEFAKYRGHAKILNFSIVYGVTEFGLSQSMGISREEARKLIAAYFEAFPGIQKFIKETIEKTREEKYSENYFGRKRLITDIGVKNRFGREAAERLAINTPIQSTAADIIKLAMINIQNELINKNYKTKMLLQIHDELVFEVPIEEKNEIFAMVKDKMENIVKLDVPLKVNGGFGKNWEEAK